MLQILRRNCRLISKYSKNNHLCFRCMSKCFDFLCKSSLRDFHYIQSFILTIDKISIVSLYSAHINAEIWNIKNNAHFFDKFGIERFLINFNDFENDSIKTNVIDHKSINNKKLIYNINKMQFFFEGLENSWICYENKFLFRLFHVRTIDDFTNKHLICSKKIC